MAEIEVGRRPSYASGLLAALGWYATLIAGVWAGVRSAPAATHECTVVICGTGVVVALAVFFLGGPFLVLLAVTALILVPVHRRVSSPFLAGTLSVASAMLISVLLVGLWAVHR